MLSGAYSSTYKNIERQHLDTIKTFAENEKLDSIARARKVSIETNRRRRALAIKRKAESEKEERRRQHILAKRREQQNEATQKFQRANMPARPPSSGRWSPRHRTGSNLDDALKMVRGTTRAQSARVAHEKTSPAPSYYRQNTDPLSKPYFNKYAHPSVNQSGKTKDKTEALHNKSLLNLNNSRTLFEQQLESHQQSLVDQQQKALKDFNKQVMKEMDVDRNVMTTDEYRAGPGQFERSESVSTVDSLEENGTADTLRESCDLDSYMNKQLEAINANSNNRTVTFAEPGRSEVTSVTYTGSVQNGGSIRQRNIDSYNTQQTVASPQTAEQKQQFYLQRQQEIQQQLQEQQQQQVMLQQRQQEELKQKVLDQQQKQQMMIQQQFHQQQQQEAEQRNQQKAQETTNTGVPNENGSYYLNRDDEKENFRPKAQNKAWGTPSPAPPPPACTVTAQQTLVTNTSPYTGKNMITNMTVTTYDKVPVNNYTSTISAASGHSSSSTTSSGYPVAQPQAGSVTAQHSKPSELKQGTSLTSVNGKSIPASGMALLEEITNGLSLGQTATVTQVTFDNSYNKVNTTTASLNKTPSAQAQKQQQQQQPVKTQSSASTVTTSSTTSQKSPSSYYISSYGAAYQAKQAQSKSETQKPKQVTMTTAPKVIEPPSNVVTMASDTSAVNGDSRRETFGLVNGQLVTFNGDEGTDVTDTDSVSTICAEEPEPKEVKGILKVPPKKGGILKKAGSTGNIRDSLEITRVHLQTSADEKEQRMLRERERLKNPPATTTKKNVRFADLCYDDEPEHDEQARLFIARDPASEKPPRPHSAVQTKATSQRVDSKPPRASSASNIRTSSIPRAKTQVVKPQATAHIIQSSTMSPHTETDNKKVMIVNGTVLDKVQVMARNANLVPQVATPASVYAMTSVNQTRPGDQKANYAVSSVVMPNYPNKQLPMPTSGGSTVPMQAGYNANDGPVFDENGLRIDRTPTDDEINFLWDKVRSCLSRNSQVTPDDSVQDAHRQAAPVSNTYIDGNSLGQYNSMTRVAPNGGIRRQTSLDGANSSYSKRHVLLQQRKQQPNPNSLKGRQTQFQVGQPQQQYTVYHAPVQSHMEPQPSPVVLNNDVSESMAQFLTAEQLAEQSVSDSRIQQAMEEAQLRQQTLNAARPTQPKAKSALSMEEQRLLESLDKLNEKLQVTENTIPNNNTVPAFVLQKHQANQQQQQQQQNQHHPHHKSQHIVHRSSFLTPDGKPKDKAEDSGDKMGGFKGHTPLTQRRVIENPSHQKARLKLTTATLKKNLHRQQ